MHNEGEIKDSRVIASQLNISAVELDKVLKSLLVDDYIKLKVIEFKTIEPTEEGSSYLSTGTPEFQYVQSLVKDTPVLKT